MIFENICLLDLFKYCGGENTIVRSLIKYSGKDRPPSFLYYCDCEIF